MILSKENLSFINKENLIKPEPGIFELPEKVLQFGTGVLLRALPDYFIDKANRAGVFNGRVAVVKSTGADTSDFDAQDSLYTICVRGLENGQPVTENIISSAISRVIAAEKGWADILDIAASPELKIIISNTTELGIQLVKESIDQDPPSSFPAKVLAVLHHRYQTFKGAQGSGLVIIPTELIPSNGEKLAEIVLELARFNQLDKHFINWLHTENTFCNSLVDRIVPGKPDVATLAALQEEFGFSDELLCSAEPYRLWAIEGDEKVAETLSFATIDTGLIITPDIEIYKELKVRLLNGTHTLSSGIAFLSGIDTVKNAMTNEQIKHYIESLMADEISPAIPYAVTEEQTSTFSRAVVDRFANPSIEHLWINITFQYSMKLKVRVLPLLLNYYRIFNKVPDHMVFGFAAYLQFMRTDKKEGDKYFGNLNGVSYPINDEQAEYFFGQSGQANYVANVLNDTDFWGTDLNLLDGFIAAVQEKYEAIANDGVAVALAELNTANSN
ncbi:MAG: tagaturonate reductase [Sphingobacteriaceae bacterium]